MTLPSRWRLTMSINYFRMSDGIGGVAVLEEKFNRYSLYDSS